MTESRGSLMFDAGISRSKLNSDAAKVEARINKMSSNVSGKGKEMGKGFSQGFSQFGITPLTAGIGGIGLLLAKVTKDSYDFANAFKSGMLEVSTISASVSQDFEGMSQKIMDISLIGIKDDAEGLSKAMYQIVSAGYDGAEGLKILETAAIGATAGVTDTLTVADTLTTIINSYGMEASRAAEINDKLFATVKDGKTTMAELGASFSQVASVSAAYGISVDDILASTAAMTKQGASTSEAMTRIKAAIVALSKEFGPGVFEGRNFAEALQYAREQADASGKTYEEFFGRVEASIGVLSLTGDNIDTFNESLSNIQNSAGAAGVAFKKMGEDTDVQMQNLKNNINAALSGFGSNLADGITEVVKGLNEAFAEGKIDEFFEDLAKVLKVAAVLMVAFNASTIATTASMAAQEIALKVLITREQVLNKMRAISSAAQKAYAAAMATSSGTIQGVTAAVKAMTATMATNPFTAIIAVVGIATAAFLAFKKSVKDAKEVQEDFNNLQKKAEKADDVSGMIDRYNELAEKQTKTNAEQAEFNRLIDELSQKVPEAVSQVDEYGRIIGLSSEKLSEYNEKQQGNIKLIAEQQLKEAEKALDKYQKKYEQYQANTAKTYKTYVSNGMYGGQYVEVERSGKEMAKFAEKAMEAQNEVVKIQETIAGLKKTLGITIDVDLGVNDADTGNIEAELRKQFEELIKNLQGLTSEQLESRKIKLGELFELSNDADFKAQIDAQIDIINELIEKANVVPRKTIQELEDELKELEDQKGAFVDADQEVAHLEKIKKKIVEIDKRYKEIRDVQKERNKYDLKAITNQEKIEGKAVEVASIKKEANEEGLEVMKILTEEEEKQLELQKKKAANQEDLNERMNDYITGLDDAAYAFSEIGYTVGQIDEGIGEILVKMAELAENASNVAKSLSSGDTLGGVIGSVQGGIKFYQFFDELGKSIADWILGKEKVEEYTDSIQTLLSYMSSGGAQSWNGFIYSMQLAEAQLESVNNRIAQTVDHVHGPTGNLLAGTIEDLITAYYNAVSEFGADSDNAKELAELISQYIEAYNNLMDVMAERIGFSADDITSGLVDGVLNGLQLAEDGLGEFAASFEDLLKKAATQALTTVFQTKYLEDLMQNFYDALEDGILTEDERAALQKQYAAAAEAMQGYAEQWNVITGASESASDVNKMTGAIQSITETQADVLEGRISSIQVNVIEMKEGMNKQIALLQKIEYNTSYNWHLEGIANDMETLRSDMGSLKNAVVDAGNDSVNSGTNVFGT